ncbi:MAG: valine--tRNA ligase [Candidatus Gracilibacteria bacterium]
MATPYDPQISEKKWQDYWQTAGTYHFDPKSEKPLYSIDTPPPTVSGTIHIGHIFSYTQAEVIARFKRMQGYNVFYPFGFDDNGLPTERLVEKETGVKGSEMDRDEFVALCLDVTKKYRKEFQSLWQSVGLSSDWNLEYSSIDPLAQRVSQRSFIELFKKGRIEKRFAPALWCIECQTAVAQAEVEDKEFETIFYDLKFSVEGKDLTIATTRPEYLPACVAVFVHPDDARYTDLIGKTVTTPLGDTVPLMADDKVQIDKGTGAVMCCTYGDETDMYWVKKHNLPEKILITKNGHINFPDMPEIDGLYIKKARGVIIEMIRPGGYVLAEKSHTHEKGVHERCGTSIEILPVPQWFIKIIDIKDKLLERANEVNWYPDHMKKRYDQWVENLKWDWCISRERFFGIPIPAWTSAKTGEIVLADPKDLPVNPQKSKPPYLPEGHTYEDMIPEKDVLDTWATSSSTPEINSRWGEEDERPYLRPMDLRPQAHDIIRTWALYTIIKSELHFEQIPWKNIMMSGHVLAKKGEKISKSKNNAGKSPEELLKIYGADAVRFWACGASLGKDITLDEKEMMSGKKIVNKLWNVAQFMTMHLEDFDPAYVPELYETDKWMLARLTDLSKKMTAYLEAFEFGPARSEFEKFFWNDFCDNYLELIKGRLYKPESFENGTEKRKSAQYTVYIALDMLTKLFAPFMPHITEEIYQAYFKKYQNAESIHITEYPKETRVNSEESLKSGLLLLEIVSIARKEKAAQGIGLGADIQKLTVACSDDQIAEMEKFADDLKSVVKSAEFSIISGTELQCEILK